MIRRMSAAAVLVVLALTVAACGGSTEAETDAADTNSAEPSSAAFSPNAENDAAVAALKVCIAAHADANTARAAQGVSAFMRTIQPCGSLADWTAGANATSSSLVSPDPARAVRAICALLDENGKRLPLCLEAAAAG